MPDRKRTWDKTPEAAAYRQKYRDEHYARIELSVPEEFRERIDKAAAEAGLSRTAFIVAAVEDMIAKDK